MDDLFPILSSFPINFVSKLVVLFLVGIYLTFTFIAFVQIKALNRLVKIESGKSSFIIQNIFLIYLLLVISLFVLAIAIL